MHHQGWTVFRRSAGNTVYLGSSYGTSHTQVLMRLHHPVQVLLDCPQPSTASAFLSLCSSRRLHLLLAPVISLATLLVPAQDTDEPQRQQQQQAPVLFSTVQQQGQGDIAASGLDVLLSRPEPADPQSATLLAAAGSSGCVWRPAMHLSRRLSVVHSEDAVLAPAREEPGSVWQLQVGLHPDALPSCAPQPEEHTRQEQLLAVLLWLLPHCHEGGRTDGESPRTRPPHPHTSDAGKLQASSARPRCGGLGLCSTWQHW